MVRALVLLFVLIPTLALAQVFPRGSRRILSVNNDPTGVALADFDRDGNLDLAVTERGLDRFSLYLGDGNGGFAPRVMYDTGDSPTQIAAGDVNADGLVDLAIANSSASTVTVYLGGPLGQMVNRIDYPVGSNPFGIAIGDADSDGRTDIVTANSGSNSVTILVGKGFGNGLSGGTTTVPTGTGPRAVLVHDLNRDGVNDLVTANTAADSISVLKGLPTGGFGPRTDTATLDQPISLALGDVDADGWTDLAIAFAGTPYAGIAINSTGNISTFPLVNNLQVDNTDKPLCVALADFDQNAIPDLVVGTTGFQVSFLPGVGNGTFGLRNGFSANGTIASSVAIGDLDGDGRLDVVMPLQTSFNVDCFFNNGRGPFGPPVEFAAGTMPQGLVVTDLNGDSRPDIAVANAGSANLSTYMNQGDGVLGPRVNVPGPIGPTYLVAADLNGDSKTDLVTSTYRSFVDDTTRVSVYLNPGNGAFAGRTDYDAGTAHSRTGLAIGDLTHDGKLDIVVGHDLSTVAQILPGDGLGAFSVGPTLTLLSSPTWIDLADIDGNGSLDPIVGCAPNFSSGQLAIFKADGAGGFNPRIDLLLSGRPAAVTHGDFDKDGKLDVASVLTGNGTIQILLGDGAGVFSGPANLVSPGAQSYSIVAGDLNQDGLLDLVGGRADPYAAVFLGSPGELMSTMIPVMAGHGLAGVALAPLDGNSTLDLVTSNLDSGTISILRGRAKTRTSLAVSPNPSAVGEPITYQATVTKAFPDSANPTGSVRFFDGVRLIGSAPLVGGVATLVQAGDAPWDREFSAAYVGDGRFYGSFSQTLAHTTYIPTLAVPPIGTAPALALAPLSNPTAHSIRLRVALAGTAPARLTLVDIRGRVLDARPVHASGIVELAASLSPGVYLARIEQAGKVVTARAVVL